MYATIEDVEKRCRHQLSEEEKVVCGTLLEDAAVIVDAYNAAASADAKKLVSCNMVIRALGDENADSVPIGATQGSMSGLGYSQSWTIGNGSARELYLTKLDKKLLGQGTRIAFVSPFDEEE